MDRCLINPRGEIDCLLLADGTEVHLPPHDAKERSALLHPAALTAHGPGSTVDGSQMVDTKEIGATLDSLQPVRPKPLKDCNPPKHSKPRGRKEHRASKHA